MARRSKSSLIDDLFHIAASIPLWGSLLIAGASFAGLNYYAGAEPPNLTITGMKIGEGIIAYFPKLAAYYGQYMLPTIFVLGGVLGAIRRKAKAKKFNHIASSNDPGAAVRSLSWYEFEQMVGEAFRRQGYTVAETKKGPDGGVDLVLRKEGELFLVQCKSWKAYKVSVQVVRELYGVMAAQGAAGGFVVTTGVFTTEARKFAEGLSIQLVDGKSLIRQFATQANVPEKLTPA
jgi:restriction system protein